MKNEAKELDYLWRASPMFFEEQRQKFKDVLIINGIAIIAFVVVWLGLYLIYEREAFKQRCAAENALQKYSLKLTQAVNQSLVVTSSLALSIEEDIERSNLASEEKILKTRANKVMVAHPFISGVQIAKNGVITQETRIRSEIDSLRGVDLFLDSAFKNDTIRAVNQLNASVIGPKYLTEQMLGVFFQVPMFDQDKKFLGLVQTAVRLDKLLQLADMDQLVRAGMPYELWKTIEPYQSRWLFWYESENTLGKDLLMAPIPLPDGRWELMIEDPVAKFKMPALAAIFVIALLSGGLAALMAARGRSNRMQQSSIKDRQNNRLRHLMHMVERYRELFDAADAGFVQWDKNQCLETWNKGFEKIYPEITPYLEQGMTRKQLYKIRARFDENDIVTDWESTGTWYRQMDDGRIIMLKRMAMPDGGRLGMHVDMSASLGDQEFERSMVHKTSVADDVLEARFTGFFSTIDAKKAYVSVLCSWTQHEIPSVLMDFSKVAGDEKSMKDFCSGQFVATERKEVFPKIPPVAKLAFVLKAEEDTEVEDNRQTGNIRVFYHRSNALAWLKAAT